MPFSPNRVTSAVEAVSKMEKDDTVYVVTYQGPKIKRTVTGKYSGHEDGTLLLEDKNGRFNKVPIEGIIRVNYYIEGRAPF